MEKILSVKYLSLICIATSIIVPFAYLTQSAMQTEWLYWLYGGIVATSYLMYGFFFWRSSKDTENKMLKIGGYISFASILYFLFIFSFGSFHFFYRSGFCYIIHDYLEIVSFATALGLPAFHFILMRRSGWNMWGICVPAILGLFLIGIQFVSWELFYTFTYSVAIFIPYALLAFSFYQLYKKL